MFVKQCFHLCRGKAFLWLMHKEKVSGKQLHHLHVEHRESAHTLLWQSIGGLGGGEIFTWQTVAKRTLTCSVLSSVPIRCLTKAYLASGLHMLLSWYSGSFQYYCLQDTAIVSDPLLLLVGEPPAGRRAGSLKASQLLCPSAQGDSHPTVGEYFSPV